jgi:hypothetical protein
MTLLSESPQSAQLSEQARGGARAELGLSCEARQSTRPWQLVLLDDLSASGFRIAGLSHPDPAKALSIRIPGIQLLSAKIRWVSGTMVGCEFANPLHVAVFDHLVKQAKPFG